MDEVLTSVVALKVLGIGLHVGQCSGEEDVKVFAIKEWGFENMLISLKGIGVGIFEGSVCVSVRR